MNQILFVGDKMATSFVVDASKLPRSPLLPPAGYESASNSGFCLIGGVSVNWSEITVDVVDGQYETVFAKISSTGGGIELEKQDYETILAVLGIGAMVTETDVVDKASRKASRIKIRFAPDCQVDAIIGAFAAFNSELEVQIAEAGPP